MVAASVVRFQTRNSVDLGLLVQVVVLEISWKVPKSIVSCLAPLHHLLLQHCNYAAAAFVHMFVHSVDFGHFVFLHIFVANRIVEQDRSIIRRHQQSWQIRVSPFPYLHRSFAYLDGVFEQA